MREEAESPQKHFLFSPGKAVFFFFLRHYERLVKVHLSFQFPVLEQEVHSFQWQLQVLCDFISGDETIELVLQLLDSKFALTESGFFRILCEPGLWRGWDVHCPVSPSLFAGLDLHWSVIISLFLIPFHAWVLGTKRLKLDFIRLCEDSVHLQPTLETASNVERHTATFGRTLGWFRKREHLLTFTFIHLGDAVIQSDLQLRNTSSKLS